MAEEAAAEQEAAAAEAAAERGAPGAGAGEEAPEAPEAPEASEAGAGAAGGPEDAESQQRRERDAGNEAYERGEYAEAVKAWSRSLQSVKYILNKGFYTKNPEQEEEVRAMELRLCLNLSQGYLKTRDWTNAVAYADKALEHDAAHPKALYRKASALMQQHSFPEAQAVLERLLQAEPQNKAATAMAAEARRSAQAHEKKSRRISQKMFSALAEGRDPRVPPTRRDALLAAVRGALAGALQFLCELPQRCRELATPQGVRGIWASLRRQLARLSAADAGAEKKAS